MSTTSASSIDPTDTVPAPVTSPIVVDMDMDMDIYMDNIHPALLAGTDETIRDGE